MVGLDFRWIVSGTCGTRKDRAVQIRSDSYPDLGSQSRSDITVSAMSRPAGFAGERGTSLRCARRNRYPSSVAVPERSIWYRPKPTITSSGFVRVMTTGLRGGGAA